MAVQIIAMNTMKVFVFIQELEDISKFIEHILCYSKVC